MLMFKVWNAPLKALTKSTTDPNFWKQKMFFATANK